MNEQPPKAFTFLSRIIGIPVVDDASGACLGRVEDVSASLREMYPRACGLVVRRGFRGGRAHIPWKDVRRILDEEQVRVDSPSPEYADACPVPAGEILLKETFWDKQIVDIAGSKVVRVNDLHLLREELKLWLVHVDVGITGLLRRLGWERACESLFALLFSVKLKDRLISWKFVQPVAPAIGSDALALKVHHSKLDELHPAELAEILVDLGIDERLAILKSLDGETMAGTFQELPMKVRAQMAELLPGGQLGAIVDAMAMDEAVDLVSQLSKGTKDSLLRLLPPATSGRIQELLTISRRVAGSIMNTEFIAVRPDMTAQAVLDKVRAECASKESIYHCFVLGEGDALVGVVTLRQLLTESPGTPAAQFMRKRVIRAQVDMNIRDVAELFQKYSFTVMPVVDDEDRLQGVITMKDAFEAVCPELRTEAGAADAIYR